MLAEPVVAARAGYSTREPNVTKGTALSTTIATGTWARSESR